MKFRYIKLLLSFLLFSWIASCTDLDVDIKSQYTAFPDSEIAAEAKTADVYYVMREPLGRDYHHAQTLSSDEVTGVSLSGDYYDNGRYAHMSLHSWTPDDATIGYFETLTGGITRCNRAIIEMGGEEAAVTAPVRAVRAYYFWVLMDSYGDVPLLDRLLEEDEAIDRASRAEVAKYIEKELLEVVDLLPTNVDASTYGKPTRYMAEALLAKLYLNWAVYTSADVATYSPDIPNVKLNDVVAMCDDIIASGKFDLTDPYLSKFIPENGPHVKDFIYAMPFDRQSQQGMTYARFWTHRSGNSGFYGINLPSSVGGNFVYNPEFVDKFSLEGDDRNQQIIGGPLYVRDPVTYKATTTPWIVSGVHVTLTKEIELIDMQTLDVGNDLKGRSQGYRSVKFYMDLKTTSAQSRNQSNDVPIFRYADVLLMKAEAIMRGASATGGDTPVSLMNQIRAYVNAPLVTGNPTLDDLLDERAREFADESWRRNDLIRFGKFEDDWGFKHIVNPNAKNQKFRRIFPIPTYVLNTNTNWSQNAGY
ncbi:RagB/SusD family nutrient uptake outer membrane protein [Proteiniphilum acetatigenes]|uniref:RagB/SusD family nutrient uptake outer membrane protein n=1 Tax=Proteiniphilum acetatigenes TaxID=294710 RepID=UPI00036ABA70|nr:RagB/SusD family nutrient uptake outer membrane protein [Proteiniphilum acetatigenes]SFK71954.1 Starch-binding associating with outer membrane [Porphyromonadaceae bacterium KH3CP3RA]